MERHILGHNCHSFYFPKTKIHICLQQHLSATFSDRTHYWILLNINIWYKIYFVCLKVFFWFFSTYILLQSLNIPNLTTIHFNTLFWLFYFSKLYDWSFLRSPLQIWFRNIVKLQCIVGNKPHRYSISTARPSEALCVNSFNREGNLLRILSHWHIKKVTNKTKGIEEITWQKWESYQL